MGKLVKPENRQIEGAWFKDRWKEGEENWEDVRAKQDHPEEVLAGMHRLRPRPLPNAPVPMEMLDRHVNIGRSVTFTAASGTDFVDILNLEADDKRTRLITIHTVRGTLVGGEAGTENLQGRIEWGAGGVRAVLDFDWLFGTTLSMIASSVRVSVRTTQALGAGANVTAGAFAGYNGVGTERTTPQLTVPTALVAAGAFTGGIAIPNFAKDITIARRQVAAFAVPPAFRVHLIPLAGAIAANATEQYAAGVPMERPMPLPPGVLFFTVENLSLVNAQYDAIFGLAI